MRRLYRKALPFSLCLSLYCGAACAANPFADVPPAHWSYQETKELVASGLVDDYTNSMFEKNRRITRQAIAQLVGQALYRINEATPSQKTSIGRLAAEYHSELERMGAFEGTPSVEASAAAPPVHIAPETSTPSIDERLNKLEKDTSSIQSWKLSGWANMENTYGQRYWDQSDHEYKLEARLQVDKKISDSLDFTFQMAVKTYLDGYSALANDNLGQEFPNSNKEKIFARLAYLSWKPAPQQELLAGKFAVWLAGGFLGDDYLKGIQWNYATDRAWHFSLLASRYEANTDWPGMAVIPDPSSPGGYRLYRNMEDRNIWYAKIGAPIGRTDIAVHYLGANSSFTSKDDTSIVALTLGGRWRNIDLGAAWGQNIEESGHNNMLKLQAAKTFGKHNLIAQYWRQEANMDLPLENGNHMAWWGDQYSRAGLSGYRLIYSYRFTDNLILEGFYGNYRSLAAHQHATKYGFTTTVQF